MAIEQLDSQSRQNIIELIDCIRKEQCCVFVGAGLSRPAGYPLWKDLIKNLKDETEKIEHKKIDDAGLKELERAELYSKIIGEEKFTKFIVDIFNPNDNKQPCSQVHRDLVQMPFTAYVTTNFDCLLEDAFIEEGEKTSYDLYPLLQVTHLRDRRIFHIHGIIDYKDLEITKKSIILTKSYFDEAYSEDSELRRFLKSLYSDLTIMFVGFSLNEPYLMKILEVSKIEYDKKRDIAATRNMGTLTEPKHYAFLAIPEIKKDNLTHEQIESYTKSYTEKEDSRLQELGVSTIRYKADELNHTQLINLISEMNQIINERVETKISRDDTHWSDRNE